MKEEEEEQEETARTERRESPKKRKRDDGAKVQQTKREPVPMKTRRVRVYPTHTQKAMLRQWMGAVRWTYNQCTAHVNEVGIKGMTIGKLRAWCVKKDALIALNVNSWASAIPFDIRDEGARDLLKAFKSNFAKKRKQAAVSKTPFTFRMQFRSVRAGRDTITVFKKHWGRRKGVFAPLLAPGALRSAEPLPDVLEADSRLLRDKLGRYWMCMPVRVALRGQRRVRGSESQAPSLTASPPFRVAAMDPGVRTFQTVFSLNTSGDADPTITEWGANDMNRIFRLCYTADNLRSRMAGVKSRVRCRMRRALLRIYDHIRCCVADVHWKLANWLCANHDLVILPTFETQQMVRRGHRRLRSKTARQMCTWSHYSFRQRLFFKSREYQHCRVVVTSEAYTSKTCGACGVLHNKLGGSKTFKCPSCGVCLDRDANGARNILLRALTRKELELSSRQATCKRQRGRVGRSSE